MKYATGPAAVAGDDVVGDEAGGATPEVGSSLVALGQEMETLKAELEVLEGERRTRQARYDELRQTIVPDAMREAGMLSAAGRGSFTLPSGVTVFIRNETYASVRRDAQDDFHAWLRGAGHGDLIKETVHHSTLKAFVREQREAGADLPSCVETHDVQTATLRRPSAR